ncbi:MAG: hypothetical protein GY953_27560, partial [bacterium]|nr:hypothetical protein [bacterium]
TELWLQGRRLVAACNGDASLVVIDLDKNEARRPIKLAGKGPFGLFAPRHGVVARVVHDFRQRGKIERENALKELYRLMERDGFPEDGVPLREFAAERRLDAAGVERELRILERAGLLIRGNGAASLVLTEVGRRDGARLVRNHRLWELYLTNEAAYEVDHVHDDAEIVEHLLGEEAI